LYENPIASGYFISSEYQNGWLELEGVVVTALGIKNLKLSNFARVVNNEELTQAANPTWYNR
jgi:hypothetical protein